MIKYILEYALGKKGGGIETPQAVFACTSAEDAGNFSKILADDLKKAYPDRTVYIYVVECTEV